MYEEDSGVAVLGVSMAAGAGISGSVLVAGIVVISVLSILGLRWWYAR